MVLPSTSARSRWSGFASFWMNARQGNADDANDRGFAQIKKDKSILVPKQSLGTRVKFRGHPRHPRAFANSTWSRAGQADDQSLDLQSVRQWAAALEARVRFQQPVVEPVQPVPAEVLHLLAGRVAGLGPGWDAGLRERVLERQALLVHPSGAGELAQLKANGSEQSQRLLILLEQLGEDLQCRGRAGLADRVQDAEHVRPTAAAD